MECGGDDDHYQLLPPGKLTKSLKVYYCTKDCHIEEGVKHSSNENLQGQIVGSVATYEFENHSRDQQKQINPKEPLHVHTGENIEVELSVENSMQDEISDSKDSSQISVPVPVPISLSQICVQLIGDSQCFRFKEYIQRQTDSSFLTKNDFTFPGITIGEIKKKLKESRLTLALYKNVSIVLFIGTDDILKGITFQHFKTMFLSLVRLLKRLFKPDSLCIVSFPTFICSQHSAHTPQDVTHMNKFILTLKTDTIKILRWELAEEDVNTFFNIDCGRPDCKELVHFNDLGLKYLSNTIKQLIQKP